MSELQPVLGTLVADADAGQPVGLCAVVETKGSTPQAPGACMLVRHDYSTCGTLGGGCVEADVKRQAFELLQAGRSGLLEFVLDHDYGWDDGLICGGKMTIGVVPVTSTNVAGFREALTRTQARQPASIPILLHQADERVEYRINLEVPPTLLIAGAGHVGQALARLAGNLDFHVVVIDDRADMASPARFPEGVELLTADIAATLREYPIDPGCYVVIVTRGHQHDHQALDAVIRSQAGYIGLIGSKRKARMILKDLADAGVSKEQIERIHTPIGLPIGAITVPEIAVSIAAQLIDHRRRTTPKLVEKLVRTAGKDV